MTLMIEDKKAIVAGLNEVASDSIAAVAANYCGLSVAAMDELRSDARKAGVFVKVARNTLAKRAIKGTSFDCLEESLQGPIVLLFSKEDPGACARLLSDFIKDHEAMEVVSLVVDGNLLPANQLKAVASLPSYEQAVSQLMSVMIAPATKLAQTTNETVAQVVRVLSAVADKKKAA